MHIRVQVAGFTATIVGRFQSRAARRRHLWPPRSLLTHVTVLTTGKLCHGPSPTRSAALTRKHTCLPTLLGCGPYPKSG